MIEIKTDADAKALIGELAYYPGCGLLGIANAKLADGKLYIAPSEGAMFSRVDHPERLRLLNYRTVSVATPPPPPPKRRDFSGLLPLRVKFTGLGPRVEWGKDSKFSASDSAWPKLVVELLTEYAREHNLCFPKDTEVRVEFGGAPAILRLEHDVQ